MDILKKLDSEENMCKLAKEYGVRCAILHYLKKKQKKVGHMKTMEPPGRHKTLRIGELSKNEKRSLHVVYARGFLTHSYIWRNFER